MNKQEIHAYLREKGLDPKIRLPLPNGGQYLDNFLLSFSKELNDKIICSVMIDIGKKLNRDE